MHIFILLRYCTNQKNLVRWLNVFGYLSVDKLESPKSLRLELLYRF